MRQTDRRTRERTMSTSTLSSPTGSPARPTTGPDRGPADHPVLGPGGTTVPSRFWRAMAVPVAVLASAVGAAIMAAAFLFAAGAVLVAVS
ncbi:MAG TPA: hypothetical protein VGC67_13345 [Cellulomonas sp.]